MKPCEEMHSAVEEVDVDPCDLYLDLGALIVEGRIPALTERGFGEGPHCPTAGGTLLSLQPPQSRHRCGPEAPECQRYEQIQKHMLLLWKNGIPMSIEVLLYPSCCFGSTPVQSIDTSSVPDMSYILLEQWTVHMLPRRVPDASINPRGLMQAIRSFLHFSQLCAWFSLTGGKSPQNVHYRVCVPGEAFSSRFAAPPDSHAFPIANIGRNAAMKVLVKTHPRCGEIPVVPCHKHAAPTCPSKAVKQEPKYDTLVEEPEESLIGAEGEFIDGVLPAESQQTSRTSSPADSMLGESLLDPPNSLCMYPKRYQSPSRCGSPSLEVPEHLMFGKGATAKREAHRQRFSSDVQNRSRPHQRPVIERVLKKTLGDSIRASTPADPNLDKRHHGRLDHMLRDSTKNSSCVSIDLRNYLCADEDLNMVPKAEMETVLHRLRNRCTGNRVSHDKKQCLYLYSDTDRRILSTTQIPLEKKLQEMDFSTSKLCSEFGKLNLSSSPSQCSKTSQPHLFGSVFDKINAKANFSSENKDFSKKNNVQRKTPDQHSKLVLSSDLDYLSDLKLNPEDGAKILADMEMKHPDQTFCRGQHSYYSLFKDTSAHCVGKKHANESSQRTPAYDDGAKMSTYQLGHDSVKDNVPPNLSGVNIKKCGPLLERLSSNEGLIDERKITHVQQLSPLLQKLFKSNSPDVAVDDCDFGSHVVPSAADKAQFRRSLDSATCLVFHQKSGLPLTSSPAPIRKSGTCFDFDSSLTSVSAIKRALFEKEPVDDVPAQQQKAMHFSISAPASMAVSSLLGTFEESVLNGRLEPVSTVEGFTAEIGASGSFCPRHITLPVTIFFYSLQDIDKVTSPYLGHINLGQRDYHIPKSGTVQVTLFNPHHTVVKMFVVRYDLSDMPPNCQTFLRQRTLYMPTDASEKDPDVQKWLRYLIHLRFASSKSGRIFLHTDIRVIIFRKSDLDAATVHGQWPYELRSFTQGPINPKFSPRKL